MKLPRSMFLRLPDPSPVKPQPSSSQCSRYRSALADTVPLGLVLSGQWLGSPTLQGLARPWVFAEKHSPGVGWGTGEPHHSPKHTWASTGKRSVSSPDSKRSYRARTTAPCTPSAQRPEQEAETQ